ncbi:MAG: hypothetical protein E6190_06425, partial [Finegoldia magna]|nr:hypothetical protein [Finegoldia magna]
LNGVKTSALRRWLVSLGLIALEQTTRFTGGHDLINYIMTSFNWSDVSFMVREYVYKKRTVKNETRNFEKIINSS